MAFNYSISGVPDIDQKWEGLPQNGANYCVPASMLNWMYYYAARGWPQALTWQTSMPWHEVFNLLAMGEYMDTDAETGTNTSNALDGMSDWLDDHGLLAYVKARRAREGQNVTYKSIRNQLQAGANLSVSLGRYLLDDGEFERETAHAMTLVALKRTDDGELTMSVHDPIKGGGSIHTQSATEVRTAHPVEQLRNIEGEVVKVLRWGNDTNPYRFIDGWMAMMPVFAMTNRSAGVLTVYTADIATGKIGKAGTRDIKLPFKGAIADIALHPDEPIATVVAADSGEVWTLLLGEQTWSQLAGVKGARFITYRGRRSQLFVAQGRRVQAFDDEGAALGDIDVGAAIEAISFDHKGDRLIVACGAASAASKRLLALSPALKLLGETPAPPLPGKGRLALSVNSRDASITCSREGGSDVATVRWLASGALVHTRFKLLAQGATAAAHVNPKGRLVVVEAGKIATFDGDGNRVKNTPFDGLAAGPLLKVARSTNTLDPAISQRKAWMNRGV